MTAKLNCDGLPFCFGQRFELSGQLCLGRLIKNELQVRDPGLHALFVLVRVISIEGDPVGRKGGDNLLWRSAGVRKLGKDDPAEVFRGQNQASLNLYCSNRFASVSLVASGP